MKFAAKSQTQQEIPTAALPDIIFMLLFFFMVSTIMRETEVKVEQKIPRAEQLVKLQRKDIIAHIYVGAPIKSTFGKEPVIQADGAFIDINKVGVWVEEVRAGLPEAERDQLTVSLKVDKEVQMGLIVDIQTELRKVNARKIIYQSPQKKED
ncbi:MAG: biopolymer transporter ExbD [Roseivirga sp.]|nr:biopolymer transporter ExbD [Roseivirga sp.]